MPNWVITSREDARFQVRIGAVARDHAELVLADLQSGNHGQHPADLRLQEADQNFKPLGVLGRMFK